MRRSRRFTLVAAFLSAIVALAACSGAPPTGDATGKAGELGVATVQGTQAFDPSVDAPLPYNRIVTAYGIAGGSQVNGPASTLQLLDAYLPQLQQLGQQYAALDPTHPVKLGVDLVVNAFDLCASQYCASWDCSTASDCQSHGVDAVYGIDSYVTYCQRHNLLLFLDVQLGTLPVKDAVLDKHILPYLEQYPFVELELDTEFHFPDTAVGHSLASQYLQGSMSADEVNWAVTELAQISLQYHLPSKVLVTDQWYAGVFSRYFTGSSDASSQKNQIKPNPNVSLVLQSDGFGYFSNKLYDYQAFVQEDLLEYGGYKLFYGYPNDKSSDIDFNGVTRVQTPQEIMQLFPQPLFISYQ